MKLFLKYKNEFLGIFFSSAFFLICSLMLWNSHANNLEQLTNAAYGVIIGKPHWLAYQNRLLGPYSVLFISKTGLSFVNSLLVFHFAALFIFIFLIYWLLKKEKISLIRNIISLFIILFLFIYFQNYWFYTWDSVDMIIFTLFSYGIVKSLNVNYFLVLFFIAMLNRESALFIGVYLILNSFDINIKTGVIKVFKNRGLFTGVTLLISGVAYIKFIRQKLFIAKPNGLLDTEHEIIGNHINLISNLKELFYYNFFDSNIFVTIFILASLGYFFFNVNRMNSIQIKLFIMLTIIFSNILVFGQINETRMLFILFPLILFLKLSFLRGINFQNS